jgi:hypothetical protein
MNAPDFINLPKDVAPNQTVDISIDLVAPIAPSIYKGVWMFEDNTTGRRFGLGRSSTGQIWVQVKVISAPTSTATPAPSSTQTIGAANTPLPIASPSADQAYDFAAQICSAQWQSNKGTESCLGSSDEAQGAISLVTQPTLEDGTTLNNSAILINSNSQKGFIRGIYPEYLVQPGDHFQAIASCEANATTCSALFRVSYQEGANAVVDLWAVGEFYDQKYTQINIDLSSLAGKKVKIILDVTPLNTEPSNRVFWASPRIYRETPPTSTPTMIPTATYTATITPPPTATLLPTSTPIPQQVPSSTMDKIQKFFDDLFKNIFGG